MIPNKTANCKQNLSSVAVLVRKSAKEEQRTRTQGCTGIQISSLKCVSCKSLKGSIKSNCPVPTLWFNVNFAEAKLDSIKLN